MTDNNARGTLINQVGVVFVPVADQDLALGFYLDTLGFEKRADFTYVEDSRWMEVAPPGAANTIALVRLTEGEPAGGEATRCAFATEVIEADHADLRARGVDAEIAHTGKRRGSSRPRSPSWIPCHSSFSTATQTATASLIDEPDHRRQRIA